MFVAKLSTSSSRLELLLHRIAIFSATRWEFQAITRAIPGGRNTKLGKARCYRGISPHVSVTVIQMGVGIQNALRVSQDVLGEGQWDLAISSGFAGALIPTKIGAFVLPQTVVCKPSDFVQQLEASSLSCSVEFLQICQRVVETLNSSRVSGVLVTVPGIVWSVSEKRTVAETFQASALDMESVGIAEQATKHGIPFLVMRTVSDLKDESLPEALNLFLSSSTWIRGTWRIISQPAVWVQLFRLQQQTKVASQELTKIFETFFLFVGQQDQGSSQRR